MATYLPRCVFSNSGNRRWNALYSRSYFVGGGGGGSSTVKTWEAGSLGVMAAPRWGAGRQADSAHCTAAGRRQGATGLGRGRPVRCTTVAAGTPSPEGDLPRPRLVRTPRQR